MPHRNKRQQGFTLIELAIILLILGLLIAGFFAISRSLQAQKKYDRTIARQDIVARELDSFAQVNGRLPCPADPAGAVEGQARTTCTTVASRDGVVPYHDLGLTREMATDGYGNPFTYVASAVGTAPDQNLVHANCRTNYWIDTSSISRNPLKARFCCAQVSVATPQLRVVRDLTAMTDEGFTQTNPNTPLQSAPLTSEFGSVNIIASGNLTRQLDYIAYALISHGMNGELSYRWRNAVRKAANAPGAAETENANGDALIVDWRAINTVDGKVIRVRNDSAGTQRYDDMVLWKTQTQIVRESRSDTCNLP